MNMDDSVVAIVAAVARNGVIGNANTLPWHLPADLRHFRELTWGKPIVMGRKTAESLGKALPGRENIVISRQQDLQFSGMDVVGGLDEALAGRQGEIMIIGGAEIYRQAIPRASLMFLTLIDADIQGDTVFPEYVRGDWKETASDSHPADQTNPFPYQFLTLSRRQETDDQLAGFSGTD